MPTDWSQAGRRKKGLARLGPDRRGATALEFAAISATLVMVLLLLAEIGWQLAVDVALNAAVSAASRYGITGQGYTDNTRDGTIVSKGLAIAALLDPGKLSSTVQSYATPASYAAGSAGSSSTGLSGQFAVYTYTYNAPYLTSFAATIFGSTSMTHKATVLVQNEPF